MVVGLTVATPSGRLDLGAAPASAAGPDLRQLVLGSEGAFGVITSVTVRVRRLPEAKVYDGWRWPSFADGAAAMRTLAQAGLLPTVIRLSDEAETAINLARPDEIGSDSAAGCLMIAGYEGAPAAVGARRAAVGAVLAGLGGTDLGEEPGRSWVEGRFRAPYLRDSMLDVGVLVETLETATWWSNLDRLYADVKTALEQTLGEGTIVLCHISHVYETGCSLYFTVAAKETDDPLAQWGAAKTAAGEAIAAAGATITHHHAVGTDHKPWYRDEIGDLGVAILRAVKAELDPTGILNPGVLIHDSPTNCSLRSRIRGPRDPPLHLPGQPGLRRRGRTPGRRTGGPAAARRRRPGRGHLLARTARDAGPAGRRDVPWRRGRVRGRRRDAVLAGRSGRTRRRNARGPARRSRQRLRPDARAARRPGRSGRGPADRQRAAGRPALPHPSRSSAAIGRRLRLRRRRRARRRDRGPGPAAAGRCSTPTPRSARWRRTSPGATGSRSTASSASTPPRRSSSRTPPTTARA